MGLITVIIPTLNRQKLLLKLVKSLNTHTKIDKIIVVNTSSVNIKFNTQKTLVINNKNLLVGKNIALNTVKTPWVLFLDDDILIKPDVINSFLQNFNKYSFDAASGLIIQKNFIKNLLINSTPYGFFTFFKVGSLNYKNVYKSKPYKCNFLPGGFLFVKTSCIKNVGGFDQKYLFPYFNEDTDVTLRMQKFGYKIMVIPNITAVHLKHKSGGTRTKISVKDWYYAFGFNNSYFYFKNFNLFYYFLYFLFNLRDFANVLLKFNIRVYIMYIKGILYGYKKSLS